MSGVMAKQNKRCVKHGGDVDEYDAWWLCDECAIIGYNKCKCGGNARAFGEANFSTVGCEECDEHVSGIGIDARKLWNDGVRGDFNFYKPEEEDKVMAQMQIENLKAIFDNEDSVSWDGDNALEGLNILANYFPGRTVLCAADHDIIYSVDAQDALDAGLSLSDAQKLAHLNWMVDWDSGCLACYV